MKGAIPSKMEAYVPGTGNGEFQIRWKAMAHFTHLEGPNATQTCSRRRPWFSRNGLRALHLILLAPCRGSRFPSCGILAPRLHLQSESRRSLHSYTPCKKKQAMCNTLVMNLHRLQACGLAKESSNESESSTPFGVLAATHVMQVPVIYQGHQHYTASSLEHF